MEKIIVVLFFIFQVIFAENYKNHQVWKVFAKNEKDVGVIRKLHQENLDFWKEKSSVATSSFDVRIPPKNLKRIAEILFSNQIEYEVVIPNVQSLIDQQKMKVSSRSNIALNSITEFDYSKYHPADEIEEWGDTLAGEFSYATKFQIGVSYLGNVLNAIEIRKPSPNGKYKPTLYIDSLIHAREWVAGGAALFAFKELLTNSTYSSLLDEVDFIYVPIVNIDGYKYTWTDDRMWRKTRSVGAPIVCIGADPNRNFDSHFGEPGASQNPCTETYCGSQPESENVIRHLSSYITQLKESVYGIISIHSYSQMILFPWGWTEEPTSDFDELNNIGKLMNDAVEGVHGTDYVYGQSSTTIYITTADTTDWAYEKLGINASYTYELRDTGEFGFILPSDQIIPTGEEFLAGVVAFAEYIRNNWQNMKV